MNPTYLLAAVDLVAVLVLALAVYYPRHRRADLVTAFVAVNMGVLAVTIVLSSSAATVGLGLGLFGVLSIIRLRSQELAQHEVAYYFAALALGLLGGLSVTSGWFEVALMAGLLLAVYVGDHPWLVRRQQRQLLVLDRALPNEHELRAHLESLIGARVTGVTVQRVDLVNDTTLVEVRHEPPPAAPASGAGFRDPGRGMISNDR